MGTEIHSERSGYESRVDLAADDIESFVDAVLATIDVKPVRSSAARWQKVCAYFEGCARAAKAQGAAPRDGGKRITAYLASKFPSDSDGSSEGFFEFMDWLSNPEGFRPSALRLSLEQS